MIKRNTIQKELVLSAVRSMHSHVTADEVYDFIRQEHEAIAKGTVYRNLANLAEEGKILKVEIPEGSDRFDFTTNKHYHVCCIRCGEISDVDMDVIIDMENRIRDKHGFIFLSHDVLFKGICVKCQEKEGN